MQIKLIKRQSLYLFWNPLSAMHAQQMLEYGYGALAVQHAQYRWLHLLPGEEDSIRFTPDAVFLQMEPDTQDYALWKLAEYARTGIISPAEFGDFTLDATTAPRRRRCIHCYWMDAAHYDDIH